MMSMQYMNTYSLGVIEEEEKDYAEKPPPPRTLCREAARIHVACSKDCMSPYMPDDIDAHMIFFRGCLP